MSKLDDIIGKRPLKEMLDEPVKVLDVKIANSSNERALEKVVENYEPKSIEVLKETGSDLVRYSKKTADVFGTYILGPQLFTGLFPYISPYLFSKRENAIPNKYNNAISKLRKRDEWADELANWAVGLNFFLGAITSIFATGYLYGYQAIYNRNYLLLSIPLVTNVASLVYERIQVNKIKLASQKKALRRCCER